MAGRAGSGDPHEVVASLEHRGIGRCLDLWVRRVERQVLAAGDEDHAADDDEQQERKEREQDFSNHGWGTAIRIHRLALKSSAVAVALSRCGTEKPGAARHRIRMPAKVSPPAGNAVLPGANPLTSRM